MIKYSFVVLILFSSSFLGVGILGTKPQGSHLDVKMVFEKMGSDF